MSDGAAALCPGSGITDPQVCFKLELEDYVLEFDLDLAQVPEMAGDGAEDKEKAKLVGTPAIPLASIADIGAFNLADHLDSAYLGQIDEYYTDNSLTQPLSTFELAITDEGADDASYEADKKLIGAMKGVEAEENITEPEPTMLDKEDQVEAATIISEESFKIWSNAVFKYKSGTAPSGSVHVKLVFWVYFEVGYATFETLAEDAAAGGEAAGGAADAAGDVEGELP
jgi:hypothetical protein